MTLTIIQRVVCAHELGHSRLHGHFASTSHHGLFDMRSKPERETNLFAAELLIDDSDMLEHIDSDLSYEQIAIALSVPYELVILKSEIMNGRGYQLHIPHEVGSGFLGKL